MNKKQLTAALVKLGVAPDVFKDLDVPQLQALLTQKQIEKAQLDAENKNSQGAGADGTGDGGSDEGGDDGDDEGDGEGDGDGQGEGGSESGSAGGGAGTGDGAVAAAGALSSSAQESTFDSDSDDYEGLTKLRSRGFSCKSLGMAVSQGVTYSVGKEFKVKDGDELWADEKTCEHLLSYRVAEKA